jgi:hypothetical protein
LLKLVKEMMLILAKKLVVRNFSKFKLVKSYLSSTITQERLNGLTTIALESDVLEQIKYEDPIEDFTLRNTRRMLLFSRT